MFPVAGTSQPQNSAEELHDPLARRRERSKTFLGGFRQGPAMVARHQRCHEQITRAPAERRLQLSQDSRRYFVVATIRLRSSHLMGQSSKLKNEPAMVALATRQDSVAG